MEAMLPTIFAEGYHNGIEDNNGDPTLLDWIGNIPQNFPDEPPDIFMGLSATNSTSGQLRPPLACLDPYSFQTVKNVDIDIDSDCSWTEEDDSGSIFFEIEQRLRAFLLQDSQPYITIQPLSRQQRRVVHGMAHLMHLGHSSMKADGKVRRMHIYKKSTGNTMQNLALHLGNESASSSWPEGIDSACDLDRSATAKRLPKREGGFPCRFSDCQTIFDRACDRKKHEKRHEPKHSHPYHCSWQFCDRTFLYPKDLRRHEKVHNKKAGPGVFMEDFSTDEMFSDASVSSFSRPSSVAMSSNSAVSMENLTLGTSRDGFDSSWYNDNAQRRGST